MRNLKKVLALVLALMMTISLMATASASDYADGSSIEKTEAVEVMSMINVFQGTDGGNFDPNGNLTRAQAAKIISYMLLGQTVADALPTDDAPFDDVKAGRWYTGYVTYAKAEGIIAGRSDTIFDPNGNVTGYEFGKMVLEAAGIKGEYTGTSSWMLNINLALRGNNPAKTNLMANVDAVLSQPITREQACQMAFNALNYTPNGNATGRVIITTSDVALAGLNGTAYDSRLEAIMTVNATAAGKTLGTDYTLVPETDNSGSLADVVFGLSKARGTDTFGAPANVWTAGDDSVTVADAPVASYESTNGKTVKADLKMTGPVSAVIVTDGQAAGSATLTDAAALGGNGAKVDVYKTGDTSLRIVVVNTYVATIASHTDAKGEEKEKITLTLNAAKPSGLAGSVDFVTADFSADNKGDVVLYTAAWDGTSSYVINNVTIPESVTGSVTRFNSSANTFVLGGVTYKFSSKVDAIHTITAGAVGGADVTLYLDNNGNVIYADSVGGPDTAYAVVIDWTTTGSWASSTGYYVKLLLTDGSVIETALSKVDGSAPADYHVVEGLVGKIVSYSEANGKVEVTATVDANTSTKFTTVTRNTPTLKTGLVANNNTIFLIGNEDGVVTVYTGINSVPSVQKLTEGAVKPDFVAVADNGVAVLVYIAASEAQAGESTNTDVIYVVGTGTAIKDAGKGDYKEYTAVVNGEITTIETTTDVTNMPAAANGAVLLKSVTEDANTGLIKSGIAMSENLVTLSTSNTAPANGVIKVGDYSYSYDENTVVYMIEDGEISIVAMDSVEANASGVSITGYTKNNVIAELFILKCDHSGATTWSKAASANAEAEISAGDHVKTCNVCGEVISHHAAPVCNGTEDHSGGATVSCQSCPLTETCNVDHTT